MMTTQQKIDALIDLARTRTVMDEIPSLAVEVYPHKEADGWTHGETAYEVSISRWTDETRFVGKSFEDALEGAYQRGRQVVKRLADAHERDAARESESAAGWRARLAGW